MGKVYGQIDAALERWIAEQTMFFVATAPERGGHVNVSPKGPIESLQVLGPRTVAYLDLIGSGIETVAHLRQNGRICVMLCAFQGPPRILRLHGRGEVLEPGADGFEELRSRFDAIATAAHSTRTLIRIDLERIADSCGYGVALMEPRGERPQAAAWVERMMAKGATALDDYVAEHNAESIDALPGL